MPSNRASTHDLGATRLRLDEVRRLSGRGGADEGLHFAHHRESIPCKQLDTRMLLSIHGSSGNRNWSRARDQHSDQWPPESHSFYDLAWKTVLTPGGFVGTSKTVPSGISARSEANCPMNFRYNAKLIVPVLLVTSLRRRT